MPQPLIGLTCNRTPANNGQTDQSETPQSYSDAVIHAGGLPVIIPLGLSDAQVDALFTYLDGVVIIGGVDVDPARFNGRPHPRVYGIDSQRDAQEVRLVQLAVTQRRPLLGICRGIQVMNVALGGTLYTDLADQFSALQRHDWYPEPARSYLAHTVDLEPSSRLAGILGGVHFQVNSLHHQGLEQVSPVLQAVGRANDGLVEAVEVAEHPFAVGVQWHPEWLQEYAPQRAIFSALVAAASAH